VTNNYKQDDNKPPVLDAVHIPFRRALLAVARMCEDMKEHHKLSGAKDPFQEWRHLPDARRRLANAAARHGMNPWGVNTKDGAHLHAMHALWGWLAAVELWEEEQEKIDAESPCCGAPDADGSEFDGSAERHSAPAKVGSSGMSAPAAITGPAGADWRERTQCGGFLAKAGELHKCLQADGHAGDCSDSEVSW
jgi:hypothetical protein